MVYLLTMVIFHGYVRHNQIVSIMVPLQNWNSASWNPGGFLHRAARRVSRLWGWFWCLSRSAIHCDLSSADAWTMPGPKTPTFLRNAGFLAPVRWLSFWNAWTMNANCWSYNCRSSPWIRTGIVRTLRFFCTFLDMLLIIVVFVV